MGIKGGGMEITWLMHGHAWPCKGGKQWNGFIGVEGSCGYEIMSMKGVMEWASSEAKRNRGYDYGVEREW